MDPDCGPDSAVLVKDINVLNKEGALLHAAQFNAYTADDSLNIVSNYLPVLHNNVTVSHHQKECITRQNFAPRYSSFGYYNDRYLSEQTAEESTPAYSRQPGLHSIVMYPEVCLMSQSAPSVEQHFLPGHSLLLHDSNTSSCKQHNVRVEECLRASEEQPYINLTGITSGGFILPHSILAILQPLPEQGNVKINFKTCNNNGNINPIQHLQEIKSIQCKKGQVLMEQQNKTPLSEIPMIYSSKSFVRNSLHDRISMSEQPMMLHETVQNGSYDSLVLNKNDNEEGTLGTDSPNLAVMRSIDNNKNIRRKTEQKFHCQICEMYFSSIRDLQLHWNAEHAEDTLLCGICNRQFATLSLLRKHKLNHGKLYSCEICEFRSFRKKRMAIHMAKHSKETSFVCDKCREPFTRQGDLTSHLYRCHSFH